MERLKDKIIAITGAGSGIGKTAAKMFAAENATVLVLELNGLLQGRRLPKLRQRVQNCWQWGPIIAM